MKELKISLAAARVNAKMTQEDVAKTINKSSMHFENSGHKLKSAVIKPVVDTTVAT